MKIADGQFALRTQQSGAALLVVLVLLVVVLVLGLSSASSSRIDETIAGNYRMYSKSQMGAEQGASVGFRNINESTPSFAEVSDSGHKGYNDPSASIFGGESADCDNGVTCRYDYIEVDASGGEQPYGKKDGFYIVSIGAVMEGDDVVSKSEPIFVELDKVEGFGGLSSALTIFGGIKSIYDTGNDKKWLPSSKHAEIRGGELSNEQLISAVYYEGRSFDVSSKKNKNPIKGEVDHAGEADESSMEFLDWLISDVIEAAEGKSDINFINEIGAEDESFDPKEYLVNNDVDCDSSNTYFALVNNYESSGNGKFCGVIISLGDATTLGGTVTVDGLLLSANPENGFDSPSGLVDIDFNGGGGQPGVDDERGGSVRFKESVVEDAFLALGLDYLNYMSGTMAASFDGYRMASWQ